MRPILWILAAAALLLTGACVDEPGQSSESATELISEPAMAQMPERPGEMAVVRDAAGPWRFQLVGDKGSIFLLSQDYVEKVSAINGILSVEDNGVLAERYLVSQVADGEWKFVLRAGNNQEIGASPIFRNQEDAEAAVIATRDLIAGIVQWKAAVTNGARFDLWRDQEDKQWYFVLRAADGRVLLESEDYQARTGAVNGIESVRENGKNLARYQLLEGGGEHFFVLKAGNGQEIGRSTAYATPEEAQAAIDETNQLLISEKVGSPW